MPSGSSTGDPVQKMTRMYRWTRHVYDLTRRHYLLGRDSMLEDIARQPAGPVLEMGCGTARNLRVLADLAPDHELYGIDASMSMLSTARRKIEQSGLENRISLGHGLAQSLHPKEQLGVDTSFDVIFFSYVLSMIPSAHEALHCSLAHLSAGGQLHIVDFWDQGDLPSWFATLLRWWLEQFDVYPHPDLINTLNRLDNIDGLSVCIEPVAQRYAYNATVKLDTSLPRTVLDVLDTTTSAESQRFGSSEIIPG